MRHILWSYKPLHKGVTKMCINNQWCKNDTFYITSCTVQPAFPGLPRKRESRIEYPYILIALPQLNSQIQSVSQISSSSSSARSVTLLKQLLKCKRNTKSVIFSVLMFSNNMPCYMKKLHRSFWWFTIALFWLSYFTGMRGNILFSKINLFYD